MTSILECGPHGRLITGEGAASAVLLRMPLGRRPVILRDSNAAAVRFRSLRGAHDVPLDPSALDNRSLRRFLAAAGGATAIIAAGGGSVIDVAKIVRLLLVAPELTQPIETLAQRSGYVPVPELRGGARRELPLVALPTTFGTGAEVSGVACMLTSGGRRLLAGAPLRPDQAILDPTLTASLPANLQAEGLLEVILRVMGPAIGSHASPAADYESRAIVIAAAELAETLRTRSLVPAERLLVAQLSASTHRGWALAGRELYAAKHWYLANELSWVTGASKIPATVAVLPAIWGRIADGDCRWGSPDRLTEAWSWLRAAVPGLPSNIREGLAALFDRWQIHAVRAAHSAEWKEAAARTHAAWGGSLPALGRIERSAIDEVFAESFEAAKSRTHTREEVRQR